MKDKKVNIAIIGAGTAGLSAFKEASKYTKDIVIIDKGPLGSTCARVGCMPSKLLIHTANEFYTRNYFDKLGIKGANQLTIDIPQALEYVRKMRDKFTAGVIKFTRSLGDQFICGEASFIDPNTLQVGKQKISANKIIIATGSKSVMPEKWLKYGTKILTSENIFDQHDFANDIAVIGGGIIGLELGQSLARLGINISLFDSGEFIGGLTDPKVNETAINILKNELSIHLNQKISITQNQSNGLAIQAASKQYAATQLLVAIGRKPNLANLRLNDIDIKTNDSGIPEYDNTTMQLQNLPIYIAGDVNKTRPLLHEAADEGRIAGFNAANNNSKNQCFQRRTPIRILFSQPNIAIVGKSFNELSKHDYAIGEVDYGDQGRAKIMNQNKGLLRIYALKKTGELLGAECIAPDGEHLAHLLAWAMQKKLTVFDMLQMPFYHPVVEEGMRTALRDLAKQVTVKSKPFELAMCDSEAITPLT